MRYGGHVESDSLVSSRLRIVYVPTPKVACTSVKWAISKADGAYTGRFNAHAQLTPEQSIHSPLVHGLPALRDLSGRKRREAVQSPEWVRFCVTRSPYDRVLSGWADKVLLHHLNGSREVLERLTDLGVAFRQFVDELAAGNPILRNRHLSPQAERLDIGSFPYTDVVDIAQLNEFLGRVRAANPSRVGMVLGARTNEGLALRADDMYDARTAQLVERIYAPDFEVLGYPTRQFAEEAPAMPVSENDRRLMIMVRDREERVAEFSRTMRSPALVPVVARLLIHHAHNWVSGIRSRLRR